MARIVLATIGSLGDLHPFIAIGRSLAERGQQIVLGVPADGVAKVRAAGLDAAPILPSYGEICGRLGLTEEQTVTRLMDDPGFIMDEILIPSLGPSTRALDGLAEGADVLVASIFAFAAGIVAEKRRLPLASVVLQPMTLMSAWQPPVAPRFGMMRHHPKLVIERGWNGLVYRLGRMALRRRYAAIIDTIRREHGLEPDRGAPLLDRSPATRSTLCCWSSTLGTLPPDAPADAALVGFPHFDSESGADAPVPEVLQRFLAEGEPPLVFTLGSVAVAAADRFYEEATAASRSLGRRALLLTGRAGQPRLEGDRLSMGYAPHSAVFPRAAAVIHHGGVGTTGQALRAGKVQVVVPHYGDQFDNADRIRKTATGMTIRRQDFRMPYVGGVIAQVLADDAMRKNAERSGRIVAREDGAAAAAAHIMALASPGARQATVVSGRTPPPPAR